MSFRCIKAFMHAFSGRFSRTCLEGISFNFFVCFIFNVSLGSAPKRKNFDIQRNTRVASGGQFTLNYHTPSQIIFGLNKGSLRVRKVKFFWTLFKRPLTPPPFIWTFVLFCRGCFLNAFLSIWYNVPILPPNFTINASNVGVREAPCKKSFGILASYWTPPKIK